MQKLFSGRIFVDHYQFEDIALIDIPTGHYVIYILADNLGVDQLSFNEADEDLNDTEFEQKLVLSDMRSY